jgi:hypothetical protein
MSKIDPLPTMAACTRAAELNSIQHFVESISKSRHVHLTMALCLR